MPDRPKLIAEITTALPSLADESLVAVAALLPSLVKRRAILVQLEAKIARFKREAADAGDRRDGDSADRAWKAVAALERKYAKALLGPVR